MIVKVFVGLAILIVALLSMVAMYYVIKLKQHKAKVQSVLDEQEKAMLAKQQENHKSIVFLANALLQDQLTLTEAGMRIHWLSKSIDMSETQREMALVFEKVATATQHIPILEEWKKLTRKQQFQFDKQRVAIEKEYSDFAMDSAKKIIESNFS